MSDRAPDGDREADVEPSETSTFDVARFRQILGHFATGVTVITARDEDGPVGFTCQSFISLSLDPPLVAFTAQLTSNSWPRIEKVGRFCVNVLSEAQEAVARVFATKAPDKFVGVGWSPTATGSPLLTDTLAWVDCRVDVVHEAGDHYLVIGRVLEMGVGEGVPLLFFRGGFGRFEA